MRKGFTLIELLITMVLVAVLAVIALPKYMNALERGRVTEAVTVLSEVSEAWNAQYVINDNTYPEDIEIDIRHLKYFGEPYVEDLSDDQVIVKVDRSDNSYTLSAVNTEGALTKIQCEDDTQGADCLSIGMVLKNNEYILE